MSRNGSGTYSKVNTFVAGNSVTAAGHNQNWDDLVAEMTNSVAADGQTPMTAPLKGSNGTALLPTYTFNSDPNTGTYRHGADELGFSVGGLLAGWFDSAKKFWMLGDADIAGNASITGTLGVTGAVTVPAKSFAISKFSDTTANRLFGTDGSGVWSLITLGNGTSLSGASLTATAQLPRGYIDGCAISNNGANTFDVAAGVCRDSTNTVNITVAAMTAKDLASLWAAGSSAGVRETTAIANQTYHIWAVVKSDGTGQDVFASSSTVAATALAALVVISAGYAGGYLRHIGSIIRASAAILGFTQYGDEFWLTTPTLDVNNATPGTSANTGTLTVPVGVKVKAFLNIFIAGGNVVYFSSLDSTDQAPSSSASPLASLGVSSTPDIGGNCQVWTSTSATVRYRAGGNTATKAATLGWRHPRGRDA